MNEKILIIWKENGKLNEKEVDRQKMFDIFNSLVNGFDTDNQISKKLIELIPIANGIIIDKDINSTQDVPFITVHTPKEVKVIKIIRYHKIVWSILNKYCTEEET